MKLSELVKINGASGNEECVISYLKEAYGGEVTNLGSLKVGSSDIFVAGIVDEGGVFVSENNDKIRICAIGKAEASDYCNKKIVFQNGAEGIVTADKPIKEAEFSDLYVETLGKPSVGEIGVAQTDFFENDEYVITKAPERYATCAVLEKLMGEVQASFLFSSMYKIGKKGLNGSLYKEKPKYTVLIDTIDEGSVKCGLGTAVKMMDGSYFADSKLREFVKNRDVQRIAVKTPEVRAVNAVSLGANIAVISVPIKRLSINSGKICKADIVKVAEFAKEFIKTIY